MPVIAAQVTVLHETGRPEDHAVNTFHFDNSGDLGAVDNIADLLQDFYTAVPTGQSNAISAFMAGTMIDGDAVIRLYNLDDPKPRAPIYERTFDLAISGTTDPLPSQVAIVATYETAPASGQPQRRYRNRIYLPFWKNTVVTSDGMVSTTIQNIIAAAMSDMRAAAAASIENDWNVFSPTRAAAGGTPEAGLSDVDQGWVDNSFDIQRRRKVDATTRKPWDQTGPLPIVNL